MLGGGGSPWKAKNAEGVSEVASAGGGRPVSFARRVRSQRRRVKMPRMEPRVLRREENCSATETMAVGGWGLLVGGRVGLRGGGRKGEGRGGRTEETRVGGHVGAF